MSESYKGIAWKWAGVIEICQMCEAKWDRDGQPRARKIAQAPSSGFDGEEFESFTEVCLPCLKDLVNEARREKVPA